ncbi:adenylyl cyclase-associated protein 1 isoform X1 [Aphidius gifuensis]|nr:adenylyl cyclase-associated protein 1 isoform X1 [Aphidius gifuensis]
MAVNSDEIDNKINGDTVTTPETISPELTKKEFTNDEQLINNNNEVIDIKLDINYENNNNDVSSKNSQSSNSSEEALNICKITIEKGVLGPPKSNGLFHAPGYIERTLIVGPDEDGDDSVFERSITVEETAPGGVDNNIVVDVDDEEEDLIDKNSSILQKPIIRWLSQEDDDSLEVSGMLEPPATPIAKDELALRRHKFFSDLIHATNLSANHKVHFDPLGPLVHPGCDSEREDHLEELVTRLENVTKRLESVPEKFIVETQEVAIQTQTPSPKRTNKFIEKSESIEQSIDIANNIEINLNNINSSSNMSIENYEDIIAGPVAEYLKLSEKIGGDVASHSKLVQQAFQIQLQYIKTASSRAAPSSQSEQVSLLGPLSSQIQAIQEYREKNRGSQYFNHLSAISESIPALGWVAVSPTPAPYVKEMNDAGQFYTNRVLKDWKEKDKTHVEWCKNWVQTLSDLQKYIRQYHTTGLVWAKSGTGVAPPPPPPSCGMPPPPPSMPIGEIDSLNINDDRSALFAQINKGEDITKSLKKVTSDMQTHKNPSIRSGPAPFKAPVVNSSGATMKTTLPANAPIDKPPVFNRDGKKWLVEYQKGNKNLVIEDAEMNNVVYMYRCQDSTIVIKGKINSVVMDSCRKSSVVFDSLVSSIEFVNCQSVQMQVLGKVPTISIDKTDGCQMYLNSDSLNVEVISSKSSEMNVMVPKGNGDYTEYPVPEQFKTTVNPKGLTTICVDSLG